MKWNKTFSGFGVALFMLLLVSIASYTSITSLLDAEKIRAHTYRVIITLENLLSNVKDIALAGRGFVITGNETYLTPYMNAIPAIHSEIANLRSSTSDNALQQQTLITLEQLISERISRTEALIRLKEKEASDSIQFFFESGRSKIVMDSIRTVIATMKQRELELLDKHNREVTKNTETTIGIIIASGILAFLFVGIAALLVKKENQQRIAVETQLHKALDEIRDLYDNAPCGYHSLDPDGVFVQINNTELQWLGYERDELLKKKRFPDILSPESISLFQKSYAEFKEKGAINDLEFEIIRKNGTTFPVLLNATAIYDEQGNFRRSRATLFDLTTRKLAEEKFNSFFTFSLDMLCIAGFDGYFKLLNPSWEKILGFTVEELTAKPYIDFIHPDDLEFTLTEARKLTEGVDVISFENRYLCKDGSYKWMLWSATMSISHQIIYAVARDITERRTSEAALRQSEERFSKVFHSSPVGIILTSLTDKRIFEVNETYLEIIGFTREEVIGHTVMELGVITEETRATIVDLLSKYGSYQNLELNIQSRSGETRHVLASMETVEVHKETAILSSIVDITERKRNEETIHRLNGELKKYSSQLEASNKELEAFSYSVSHDLRAPLRHIIGYVELLQKHSATTDEKSARYLTTISNAAKTMGTLIDDLLDFSRLGRVNFQPATINMNSIIADVLKSLEGETSARSIQWNIPTLPTVSGDYSLLRIALMNLLSNAVKYTRNQPSPSITITFRTLPTGEIEFSIQDNGAGFDMKYSDKLFGVFQRLHSATEFEGTGIGLAIVRRVIHRHGGETRAKGEVGKGATFSFTLSPASNI